MGLVDNIRGFFSGSKSTQASQPQINEAYAKSSLATEIVNLIDKIKRINSFDNSVWNLSNVSIHRLEQKSLDELHGLKSNLEKRLLELGRQSQRGDSARERLEDAKWTGKKPKNMSDHDFDRFQRDDNSR